MEDEVSAGPMPVHPASTVAAEGPSAVADPPTGPSTFASSPLFSTAEGLPDVFRAVGGVLDDIAMADSEDTPLEGMALYIFSACTG